MKWYKKMKPLLKVLFWLGIIFIVLPILGTIGLIIAMLAGTPVFGF